MRGWIRKPVSLREKGEDRKEERKKVEVGRRPGYTAGETIIQTKSSSGLITTRLNDASTRVLARRLTESK